MVISTKHSVKICKHLNFFITMEDKKEGRHDPGWNDPPLFTYEKATAIQANATKKGTLLNKRVAYPMTGTALSSSPKPVMNPVSPPLPGDLSQMKAPPIGSKSALEVTSSSTPESEAKHLSKSERLDKVLNNLKSLIPTDDEDDEISKRIKIMEKMWNEDKLDEHVQLKLMELTEVLGKGDIELADHLQKGLMVDYISQCSSWMSGIRQLINCRRNAKES